jgi:RNA polymerase sigma-70 factor, ECF subfamily
MRAAGFSIVAISSLEMKTAVEALKAEPGFIDGEAQAQQQYFVSRLLERIYMLRPIDRQIILLYLEGETAASIAEVTGLSASNIATKIHRLKRLLSAESGQGVIHAEG